MYHRYLQVTSLAEALLLQPCFNGPNSLTSHHEIPTWNTGSRFVILATMTTMIPKLMNVICYRRKFDALERRKEDDIMMLMTRYIVPPN